MCVCSSRLARLEKEAGRPKGKLKDKTEAVIFENFPKVKRKMRRQREKVKDRVQECQRAAEEAEMPTRNRKNRIDKIINRNSNVFRHQTNHLTSTRKTEIKGLGDCLLAYAPCMLLCVVLYSPRLLAGNMKFSRMSSLGRLFTLTPHPGTWSPPSRPSGLFQNGGALERRWKKRKIIVKVEG
ncbi:hypothetical protein RUM43_011103 [Polyplax serrata]|uniref:Uncharacterized protein n=1 Tax=Polyplax serrata TaxID=468196 RepID=A0AAN8S0U0_POLSC